MASRQRIEIPDAKGLRRFSKYILVGGSTFLLDLLLLYAFIDELGWNPVISAGIAFLTAISINYSLSRRFVFKGTYRSVGEGYLGFLLIAGVGVVAVSSGMHLLVTDLGLNYIYSRIIIAMMTGMWNYLLNLFVNFRVAGKHF